MNPSPPPPKPFLSLRARLMLALSLSFLLLFGLIFAVLLRALESVQLGMARDQLEHVLSEVASGVDGDEVARLYQPDGSLKPNYWKDPLYLENFGGLSTVARTDPRAAPFAYIREGSGFELVASAQGRQGQMLAPRAVLERGLNTPTLGERTERQGGHFLSGTVPIRDASGRVVCAMGVDFRIDSLYQPVLTVRQHSWQVMGGLYLALLLLFLVISGRFSRPVAQLSSEMQRIRAGEYRRSFGHLRRGLFRDEVSALSEVFEDLLARVEQREQTLVSQLSELRIEVDEVKKRSQVAEIVQSESFLELREKARLLRERRTREA